MKKLITIIGSGQGIGNGIAERFVKENFKVTQNDTKYNPQLIAEQYWKLYSQERNNFDHEIIY